MENSDIDNGQELRRPLGMTLLGGLSKIKRATNLLVEPPRTVLTEKAQAVGKQAVQSRTAPEMATTRAARA